MPGVRRGVTIYCGRGSAIKLPDSLSVSRNGVVWSETIYLESQKEIHPSPSFVPIGRDYGGQALPLYVVRESDFPVLQ